LRRIRDFMRSYLDRYGVAKESLLTLSVTVFLFSIQA